VKLVQDSFHNEEREQNINVLIAICRTSHVKVVSYYQRVCLLRLYFHYLTLTI